MMPESDKYLVGLLILRIAAQFYCLLNDFTEILFTVFSFPNVFYPFPAHYIRAVDSAFIALSRPHKAICRHQNTSRKIIKLFLLILPRTTEIPDKVGVFF